MMIIIKVAQTKSGQHLQQCINAYIAPHRHVYVIGCFCYDEPGQLIKLVVRRLIVGPITAWVGVSLSPKKFTKRYVISNRWKGVGGLPLFLTAPPHIDALAGA